MYTEASQITFSAITYSICLEKLVSRFGDRLEKMSHADKLDLLSVLASWQSVNALNAERDFGSISLGDYLEHFDWLHDAISSAVDEALIILTKADCNANDAMALMVTIPQQLLNLCQN